ncbi:MAG: type I restriction enzyme HsdR N-terminal domain-containing protein [Prochloron sp. SP5CPC1]|nr:type I restriction enzyme HsdR N-terminal domain-containing protein [Candidatus Paraprochloron terpiosi SP5CPC1]
MDFAEKIRALGTRVRKSRDSIQTEEATKQALVIPFIAALDYDVYDPGEVIPEFTADVGTKRGEKVDYAIMRDGKPIILMECKWCGVDLDHKHTSQLYRYFSVTESPIAILTNGVRYQLYTDQEKPNQMDSKPFLEFDLLNIHDSLIIELKKLGKYYFNPEQLISGAVELKYTREIKVILANQLVKPSDDFVKFFASQIYEGRITQKVVGQFQGITQRALKQFINEEIEKRLESVFDKDTTQSDESESTTDVSSPDISAHGSTKQRDSDNIETTADEVYGFIAVRDILKDTIEDNRLFYRDTVRYFGILLDDNHRKPICRLYFNTSQKYIALFDNDEKKEAKIAIQEVKEIQQFADRLRNTVLKYEEK